MLNIVDNDICRNLEKFTGTLFIHIAARVFMVTSNCTEWPFAMLTYSYYDAIWLIEKRCDHRAHREFNIALKRRNIHQSSYRFLKSFVHWGGVAEITGTGVGLMSIDAEFDVEFVWNWCGICMELMCIMDVNNVC